MKWPAQKSKQQFSSFQVLSPSSWHKTPRYFSRAQADKPAVGRDGLLGLVHEHQEALQGSEPDFIGDFFTLQISNPFVFSVQT